MSWMVFSWCLMDYFEFVIQIMSETYNKLKCFLYICRNFGDFRYLGSKPMISCFTRNSNSVSYH